MKELNTEERACKAKCLIISTWRQSTGYDADEAARLSLCKSDGIVDWPLELVDIFWRFHSGLLNIKPYRNY
jgi:hypothetical protein